MSDKEKEWGWDIEEFYKALLEGGGRIPGPGYTPDGLPTGFGSIDDNGNNVPYVSVATRMKMNEGRAPEDQVAPIQPGFERKDYPIYLELLADKAAGKWDPSDY